MSGRIERSAVSGKTDYLVAGFEMDDGRKISEGAQYKMAKKKGVKIISEDDLMQMVRDSVKTLLFPFCNYIRLLTTTYSATTVNGNTNRHTRIRVERLHP